MKVYPGIEHFFNYQRMSFKKIQYGTMNSSLRILKIISAT